MKRRNNFVGLAVLSGVLLLLLFSGPASAATVTWTDTTGFWDIAGNWSSSPTLPGASDDVVIDVAGTQTITHRSGTDTIKSLSVGSVANPNDNLSVTGGTLTVTGAFSNLANTTVSGGSLRLNGTSSTAGLVMSGGILSGGGTVTAGTLAFNSGQLGESGQTAGTVTVTGASSFDGTQSQYIAYGATLNLNGNTTWSAGNGTIYVGYPGSATGTLNIGNGTTFADQGLASTNPNGTRYIGYYATGTVNNAGTYTRTGVGTTSLNTATFNNTGTVNVNGGTLDLGPGSSSGAFNVASGTTLELSSGTFNVNSGSIANAGTFQVAAGTTNVAAGVTFSGSGTVQVSGGSLRNAGAQSFGALTMSGGTLSGPGTVTAGTLAFNSGFLGETGQTAGTVTVTGASSFDGTQNQYIAYGATLNLNGNTTWSAGNGTIYVGYPGSATGTLNIGSGTTFADQGLASTNPNGTRYIGYYATGTVNNAGTYTRTGVGTTSLSTATFNNTGTVNVNGGTLDLGPGSSSGAFNVASGTTLELSSGTFNVNSGSIANAGTFQVAAGTTNVAAGVTFSGSGNVTVSGGLLNSAIGSALTPGSLTVSGGTARFAGAVNTGPLTMSGGTLSGAGTVTAGTLAFNSGFLGETGQTAGTVTVTGASSFDGTQNQYIAYGATLNLNGNTTWSAGNGFIEVGYPGSATGTLNIGSGTTFADQGLASTNPNGTRYIGYYATGTVNNAGTYTRTGVGTTSLSTATFNNTGTVNVNGGTLDLGPGSSSGAFNVASGTTLELSSGTFNVNSGSIANAGTFQVAAGTTNVAAGVTFSGSGNVTVSGGLLNSAIGSALTPGSLTVSGGTARFAGAVNTGPLTMSGGTLSGAGTVTAGTLAFNSGFLGETGQTAGTVTVTGASSFDGTQSQYIAYGATLNLNGNTTWSAGNGFIEVGYPGSATGTLNIGSGTTFADQGLASTNPNGTRYIGYYATGTVNNAGTYTRTGVGTTSLNTATFNNTGTVNVNGGTLDLGPGSSSGTFNVASGTTLELSSGTFNVNSGSIANAGTFQVAAGTTNVAAGVTFSGSGNVTVSGGLLNSAIGSALTPGSLTVSGGTARFAGAVNTGPLTMSGGILSGPGTVTAGTLAFNSGFLGETGQTAGTVTVTGASSFDGTQSQYIAYGATLNLNGNTTWSAGNGSIFIGYPGSATGTLNIGSGATFADQGLASTNPTGTRYLGYYAGGTVNNAGTYTRTGVGTTEGVNFNNTGTVNVNAGTFLLANNATSPSTSSGAFNIAAGATLGVVSGTYDFNGGSIANAGTLALSGGTMYVQSPVSYSGTGTFLMNGGTLRVDPSAPLSITNLSYSTGFMGASSVTNGVVNVTNSASFDGTQSQYIAYGQTLNLNGNTTWSAGNGSIFVAYPGGSATGTLNIGNGTTFSDQGLASTNPTGTRYLGYYAGGTVNNAGTYTRTGVGTTEGVNFNNTGTVNVNAGTFLLANNATSPSTSSGAFNIAAGATLGVVSGTYDFNGGSIANAGTLALSGGTMYVQSPVSYSGTGTFLMNGGTLRVDPSAPLSITNLSYSTGFMGASSVTNGVVNVTNSASFDGTQTQYIGYGATLNLNGNTTWSAGNGTIYVGYPGSATGTLNIGSGTTFADQGLASTNPTGTRYLGYYAGGTVNNAGTYIRTGVGTTSLNSATFNNTGMVNVNGGTMTFGHGIQGTGTLQTSGTGEVTLAAASTTGNLNLGSSAATNLALGTNNITVSSDYVNANWGSGNSFTPRANVSGTGQILAAGNSPAQAQVITGTSLPPGSSVTGGSTATPTLTIGNVHVGNTTLTYQVANNDTNGPAIRGAIETTGNGANINDARLSGSGVTAGNFGPIAAGTSGNFDVIFNAAVSGPLSPALTGQVVRIANNFDNVAEQNMSIVLGTGVAAYNLAAGNATPSPTITLANQRVSGSLTQALTVKNTAPAGSYTEGLDASFGANTGDALNNSGTISLLVGQASNNSAMSVNLDTTSAGAKTGTVTLNYVSDGTGTSGLGTTNVGSQSITVTGNVYRLAAASPHTPEPVVLANQRVNGTLTQALTLQNTAANDGFSEKLNASIAPTSGDATANGAFTLLAPQATNNTSLVVGVNTATAGAKSGTATITLQSDGTGTSGFGALGIGTQTVNVSGNVYRLAATSAHTPEPVLLPNIHVGDSFGTQALTLQNTAANDGFSEKLNASIAPASGDATANGAFTLLAPQASNTTSLVVGLGNANTTTAGTKSGTATITLQSDGTGTSGLGTSPLSAQTVNVSGNVYRLAQATINNAADFNFGNVLVNSGPITKTISISNTAANDGFSEALNAAFGAFTNNGAGIFSNNSGTITGLLAGLTDASAMKITMTPSSTGTISASVQLQFQSNGTAIGNGLGLTSLASQSLPLDVTISGQVGTLAVAGLSPTSVNFGKFREGQVASQTQALTVSNLAVAPAEGLNASFGATTGGASNNGGTITSLAPQGQDATSMSVTLSGLATAGAKSGTATVNFASDGSFNNGVVTPLNPQTVSLNAEVYRLATASPHTPEPVVLANQRVNGTLTQALTLTNTAANDGFSEKLNASIAPTSGNATANGAFTLLAPQATNSTSLVVGVNTTTAGAKSGTATITLQSDGTGTSGFSALGIGTQTVNVSGNVYQAASGVINTAPLNFGTVQVGQAVSQVLSITNNATGPAGFVEDLKASFGATSGTGAGLISGTGSITGLLAGATNTSAMTVGVNTSAPGSVNGAIAVNFVSLGTVNGVSNGLGTLDVGSTSYGVQGLIQANVVNTANPVINNSPINLGNVRLNDTSPTAFVSVTNQAGTPPQAALNATISGNAPITASGAFTLLDPGATNSTSLQVGMNTGTAGAINGTATIGFVSDASNIGNCAPNCQLALPSQNVTVQGAVYRLANPQLNTPTVTLAARVGDPNPSGAVSFTNSSPDVYTEGLKASIATGSVGFSAAGSIANLAAQASDATSLKVGLNTSSAGTFAGTATVSLASTGVGTTGAPDFTLTSQDVTLNGKVYTPAVANVVTSSVNFGTVHVNDGGGNLSKAITVGNAAAATALNDLLTGSISASPSPFSGAGTLGAGLGPGQVDSALLNVVLNTGTAGTFTGQANLALASHNPDMADLPLGTNPIAVSAQVNNYANPTFQKTSGNGNFTGNGALYQLNFGNIVENTAGISALLAVFNDVAGPADLLDGSFSFGTLTDLILAGFNPFANLDAGQSFGGLTVALDTSNLGAFDDVITLHAVGHNDSGYQGVFGDITLEVSGSIVTAGVPEPGTSALLILGLIPLGLAALGGLKRRAGR